MRAWVYLTGTALTQPHTRTAQLLHYLLLVMLID